jgi:hypothetical protein
MVHRMLICVDDFAPIEQYFSNMFPKQCNYHTHFFYCEMPTNSYAPFPSMKIQLNKQTLNVAPQDYIEFVPSHSNRVSKLRVNQNTGQFS